MRQPNPTLRLHPIAAAAIAAISVTSAQAANITWVGPNASFWDLAANWSPASPGAADVAQLGAFATTLRSGSFGIQSAFGTGLFAITGGSLTTSANSLVGSFAMSSGQLAGAGTFTVSGPAAITFGGHSGVGTTRVQGATSINSTGLRLDGGRIFRNEGTLTQFGNVDLNNRVVGLAEAGNGSVVNATTGTWNVGSPGSTFIFATNQGLGDTGAGATFTNAGILNKVGAGTTTVSVGFNNNGAVNVGQGVLALDEGGSHIGSFDIAAGATLGLNGTHNFNAGSVTSPGTLRVQGGVVNFNAPYFIAGTTDIVAGTLNLSANALSGGLQQSSGQVIGAGTFTINGPAAITFGGHSGVGTTRVQGATSITSTGLRLDGGRIFRNEGTLTQTGNVDLNNRVVGLAEAGNGSVVNATTGTWNVGSAGSTFVFASNQGVGDTGVGATFTNAGILNKVGAGTTTVSVGFNNNGAVNVGQGVLALDEGGSHIGSFDIDAGTVLSLNGTHNFNAGSVTSPGTLRVQGGVVNFNNNYTVAGTTDIVAGTLNFGPNTASTGSLIQSSGQVTGTNLLTVVNNAAITFGGHSGAGTTRVRGATNITSTGLRLDGGRIFRNEAVVTQTGNVDLNNRVVGLPEAGNGSVVNATTGTWNVGSAGSTFVFASNQGVGDTGVGATFTNAGILNKVGAGTTTVSVGFNNNGAVNVQQGVLALTEGGTHIGSFDIAAGATLGLNGTHNFNAGTVTSPGTFQVQGGVVNFNNNYVIAGTTDINAGTLNFGANLASTGSLLQSSGQITGTSVLTVGGGAISFGGHSGTGTTRSIGTLAIDGTGLRLDGGRIFRNEGTVNQTGNVDLNSRVLGTAEAGNGSVLNNAGATWNAGAAGANFIFASNQGAGDTGVGSVFTNAGTFNKVAAGTTDFRSQLVNTGTLNVQQGQLQFGSGGSLVHSGAITIAAGAQLDFASAGSVTSTINTASTTVAGTLSITGDNALNFTTAHTIGGTGTFRHNFGQVTGANLTLGPALNVVITDGGHSGASTTTVQGTTSITGTGVRLDGGRTFRNEGTVTQSGNLDMNSRRSGVAAAGNGTVVNAATGTWNVGAAGPNFIFASNQGVGDTGVGAVFSNAGVFNKVNAGTTDVRTAMNNAGVINAQAGTLTFSGGLTGTTGTLRTSGGNVVISAPATTGNLIHNSSVAGSLNLVSNSITVFNDYDNANFGVGNSFDRRANVVATGVVSPQRILAGGDVNQAITGSNIVGGNTSTPTLLIGNVHVGSTTFTYDIANTGTSGPSLRGAVQTAVNGASITDARLSGDGVSAGNFGPIAAGESARRNVTVTVATAGAFAPINAQTVSIINNFENTREQLLTIGSAAGAAAYNLAAAGAIAPNPINLANQRVGGTASAALTVANTAPGGSFTEGLNAAFGTVTGAALANGGAVNLLAGGASNSSAMAARVNTATAGAKTGTVQVNFASDGAGTSGLGVTALGSQTITVNGNVYQLAAGQLNTAPLNFGTVQVGQAVSRQLSVTNTATGPAGFVEDLNVRFGPSSGTGAALTTGSGSITGLTAGASNASSLAVSVNTSAAGTVNGSIAVNYFSAGSVGGVSNGLGEVGVGSSGYAVSGTISAVASVINQAAPVINTPTINLGNVRIGSASPTQFVSLTNQAGPAPQAALNASISGTAPITASGSFNLLAPGATNSNALQVGMNTAVAGAVNGTATVSLVSDASNVGGCAPACQLTLASQTVDVAGAVYRLANPTVTSGPISLAARVGDVAPSSAIAITNASPDAFTERLNASAGAAPTGFATSGAINGLTAGASSTAIGVALNTATSGSFSGQVGLNFVSSGAGTTGAADAALAGQNVAVSGRVYATAAGQVNTTVVDFGIVHRGDAVTARNVSVTNTAAAAALNDTLRGSISGGTGPFTANGTLADLGAGASDTTSFNVALDTANAGIFSGSATVALASHNPDMADLSLGDTSVVLTAQVNNYAVLGLGKTGGGTLTQLGDTYTLDFGSLLLGSSGLAADLGIFNLATGPADLLNGTFSIGSGSGFSLGPFSSFADIVAGSRVSGYAIGFSPLAIGSFSQTITISAIGTNASGFAGSLDDTTLVLRGNVVDINSVPAPIPEPSTWALLAVGLGGLWVARRRTVGAAAR